MTEIEAALDIYEDDPSFESSPEIQKMADDIIASVVERIPAMLRRILIRLGSW